MTPDSGDRKRFNRQVGNIVLRLASGPATNQELAQIALKYTSRISDARKMGFDIKCRRLQGGLTEYVLVS